MSETDEPVSRAEATDTDQQDEYEAERAALNDLPDGIGCAEIWDHLSERRRQD